MKKFSMTPKKAAKLRDIILIVGFVLTLLLGYTAGKLFIIGLVVMILSLVPHFIWCRCPVCGKNLGYVKGDYCNFCGEKFD